jgi:tRNA threonylcarbamoyladenosine biosynthesis protein TsaE
VVALNGELGSGKTEFVHGLAQGLEVPPHMVASPSFTLVHEYPGRVPLVHLDLYRLEDLPAELLPDLEEYLSGPQVVAVEWARRLAPLLPGDYLEVDLTILGENERQLTFTGHGERSGNWCGSGLRLMCQIVETIPYDCEGIFAPSGGNPRGPPATMNPRRCFY